MLLISLVEKHEDFYTRPEGEGDDGVKSADDVAVPQKTNKKKTHGEWKNWAVRINMRNNVFRNETTQQEEAAKNQNRENTGLQAI